VWIWPERRAWCSTDRGPRRCRTVGPGRRSATSSRYCSGRVNWSLALMAEAWVDSSKLPLGGVDIWSWRGRSAGRRCSTRRRRASAGRSGCHGGTLSAADAHKADAGLLGDLLGQSGFAEILERGQREALRRHRKREDRGVGRIDLGIDGWRARIARQQVADCVDRRLDLPCSAPSRLRLRLNCKVITDAPAELSAERRSCPPG
jgi:hypothetical protein